MADVISKVSTETSTETSTEASTEANSKTDTNRRNLEHTPRRNSHLNDNFTFNHFLSKVSSKDWQYNEIIAYIKEASPYCFWIMPDGIAIKRITPIGNLYIEERKFSELTLPYSSRFNLRDLMIQYGRRIESVYHVQTEEAPIKRSGNINMQLVQPILDAILEIWANGDKKKYEYVLTWFSRVIFCGGDNHTALLFYSDSNRTLEGARVILQWMQLYLIPDWRESATLPANPKHQIEVIRSNRYAGDDAFDELLGCIRYCRGPNHSNYIIMTTSYDAFPVAETGQFVCLDIYESDKYTKDPKYFQKLCDLVANNEAASHFYTFLADRKMTEESRLRVPTDLEKRMVRQPFELRFLYLQKDYRNWDGKTNLKFWQTLVADECIVTKQGLFMREIVYLELYKAYCKYCRRHAQIPIDYSNFGRFLEGKVDKFGSCSDLNRSKPDQGVL